MRAYEILTEGGNAVPDVGAIHISEIEPTLKSLANFLGMPEVVNNALGSVGKAEYSGDIDIVVDLDSDAMKELSHDLRNKIGNQKVKGTAGNVSFAFPIENYDESKDGRKPRTGKVQVDLIPGEVDWYKTFYHSPGDDSKMKGIHRNLALHAVAANVNTTNSEETDEWGRPIESVRWMWGQKNGLARVRKSAQRNERTGKWIKRQDTELLSEPTKDPNKIAEILFRGKADASALNSVETIVDATKKAYKKKEQEKIFSDMAKSFLSHNSAEELKQFGVPKEIKQYIGDK